MKALEPALCLGRASRQDRHLAPALRVGGVHDDVEAEAGAQPGDLEPGRAWRHVADERTTADVVHFHDEELRQTAVKPLVTLHLYGLVCMVDERTVG